MPTTAESSARKLEIKKYPNRRYYDSTHSRHLTLNEIHSLIQEGHDVTVTDAKTGEDITGQLLTQIILELDTAKLESFPVPLLLRVIRMNDQLVKDFIEQYFNQALRSFLDYQRRVEEQMRRAHGLAPPFLAVSAWTEAMFKPLAASFGGPGGGNAAPAGDAAPDPAAGGDLRELVRELQRQVTELKRGQARPRAKVRRRKKP